METIETEDRRRQSAENRHRDTLNGTATATGEKAQLSEPH